MFCKFDKEDLSLRQVEPIQVKVKIDGFNRVTNVCVHHKIRFIKDLSPGFRKCEDPLGIHKFAVKTHLLEVTLEEYKLICQNYDILPGQRICRNCTAKSFNQTEPEEKEVKFLEQSMQVDDRSFACASGFVNLSLQLFDCSPLKALKPDKTVKLGKKR